MLRSMYSGISGMKNFQNKLDVIGNNIANVNTYGFKKGRITFKDISYQTISGASAGTGQLGGTNGKQIGLGSAISSIDNIHTQGSSQTTGRTLDLAVQGEGYFIVKQGNNSFYTRDGNFTLDKDGFLVNSSGYKVQGYSGLNNGPTTTDLKIDVNTLYTADPVPPPGVTPPGTSKLVSYTIGATGVITGVLENGGTATLGTITLAKFANTGGLMHEGNNVWSKSVNSGNPTISIPGDGIGTIQAGTLEMSNVDLSEEFSEMIIAQRGFQANSRIITTSDQILEELVNLKR